MRRLLICAASRGDGSLHPTHTALWFLVISSQNTHAGNKMVMLLSSLHGYSEPIRSVAIYHKSWSLLKLDRWFKLQGKWLSLSCSLEKQNESIRSRGSEGSPRVLYRMILRVSFRACCRASLFDRQQVSVALFTEKLCFSQLKPFIFFSLALSQVWTLLQL